MEWWNNFVAWLNSDDGWRILSGAIIPFIAIVAAGFLAAAIGRGSAKRVIALSDREVKASAVTALISAGRKAAVWNTLPAPEKQHIDHLIGDADIRLRLLPVPGTALAADWARHEIAEMKKNAVSFSFQAEQTLLVFRDRLIEWQARPSRAKKLFKNDLDSWAYDSSLREQELVHQQQAWAAQQVNETGPIETVPKSRFARSTATAAPTTSAAAPAAPAPVAAPATPIAASAPPPVVPQALVPPAAAPPAVAPPAVTPNSNEDIPELVEPAEPEGAHGSGPSDNSESFERSEFLDSSDTSDNSANSDGERSGHLVDDSIFSPASATGNGDQSVDDEHNSRG